MSQANGSVRIEALPDPDSSEVSADPLAGSDMPLPSVVIWLDATKAARVLR